nr:tripartite tricarboxylate transporter permease [Halomonas lionensis]
MAGQKLNTFRFSFIGSLIGALPGTGGTVANFVSYTRRKSFHVIQKHLAQAPLAGLLPLRPPIAPLLEVHSCPL